ncbi:MAG: hypothetical protein ACOY46_08630 [Bacillota bacterium]
MKPVLVSLSLILLLFTAGCSKGDPVQYKDESIKTDKTAVEKSETNQPKTDQGTYDKSITTQAPEIVVKTDNRVANQEASTVLDEVDKELSDLLDTLERLDDIDDQDLQFEGVK